MQLSLAFLIVAVFKRNSGEFPRFLEHLTGELRSWTKVLGQTYICGAFHTRQTNSSTLVQPLPLPPLLQCWTRVHAISPKFQHCIGG